MVEKVFKIDVDFVRKFKTVFLILENCDGYKIEAKDVLDLNFAVEPVDKLKGDEPNYRLRSGFMTISAQARNIRDQGALKVPKSRDKLVPNYSLSERLAICADICAVHFCGKDRENIQIQTPYNPLLDIQGNEIEWSNCPSFEENEKGDITVYFGESSKMPKRKDNNYNELIVGWEKTFGYFVPKRLDLGIGLIEVSDGESMAIGIAATVQNKEADKKTERFIFCDCRSISLWTTFPVGGDSSVVMAKRNNGRIYVGMEELGLEFDCSSVWIYDEYCNQKNNKK